MRTYLTGIARDLSFETHEACDGQDALSRLAGGDPFDVAFFDWEMPRLNGISLLRAVRARPEFDEMKVVMVTSVATIDAVFEAMNSGADDYLMKPVTPEMVGDKLRLLGIIE